MTYTGNVGLNANPPIPALNNHDEVAFRASLVNYNVGQGIYKGDRTGITPIVEAGFQGGLGNLPTINDRGEVAFLGRIDQEPFSIYKGNGIAPLTIIARNPGPYELGNYHSQPAISNSGSVAFFLSNNAAFGGITGSGIFNGEGGDLTTVIDSRDTGDFRSRGNPPVIGSDNGRLVFSFDNVNGNTRGLYSWDPTSGNLDTIATFTSAFVSFDSWAINDAGHVLYYVDGQLKMYANGMTDVLLGLRGPFSGIDKVSINNHSSYAFAGSLDAGGKGIFNGPDPTLNRIIGVGDPLDGSVIDDIAFGSYGLNDRGSIAFYADLADGRRGVYLAVIPEVSTSVLATIASVTVLCMGTWRRVRPPVAGADSVDSGCSRR